MAPPAKLQNLVNAAAARNDLDPALVQAVIQAESNWNPYAVSRKGAFGLMQLIPSTAERYGVRDVFDPVQNINGGTRYLRDLLDRYHGDLKKSLAAYNAGEQAVQRFGGVPQYPETRAYVRKVTHTYFQSGSPRVPVISASRQTSIHEVTGPGGRTIFTNE
ncbi:MAG: lytic transglycosylase domain-containing protein [Candidatus Acidiferrales bacterium]